jgi:endo-1,4-beta-D-glucanase Y
MSRPLLPVLFALVLAGCGSASLSGGDADRGVEPAADASADATPAPLDAAPSELGPDSSTDAPSPDVAPDGPGGDAAADAGATGTADTAPERDAPAVDVPADQGVAPPIDAVTADGAASHPFGSRPRPYAAGTILPAGDLDRVVLEQYRRWKSRYLRGGCDGYYVMTNPPGSAEPLTTLSEGHGYGMLIAALMAGAEPDARKIFDGFVKLAKAYPSAIDKDLMAWGIDKDCAPVRDSSSTTAADLDIAFALLLAEKQWGNQGRLDYGAEAHRMLAAILRSEINATTKLPLLGDWSTPDDVNFYYLVRSSDFMPDHVRAFAGTSPAWTAVADRGYTLVDTMQTTWAPQTGLVPDFVRETNKVPSPVPLSFANDPRFLGEMLRAEYDYNACQVPWRLGTDYLVSGDSRARTALARINTFIRNRTGDDPRKIVDGYSLAGVPPSGAQPHDCFTAAFGVAGMIDAANQTWVTAIWDELASHTDSDYYQDTIRLLAMIVMSGNWWTP